MSCQIVISDFIAERRLSYHLDQDDFTQRANLQDRSDPLLVEYHNHPFFAGCEHWRDLKLHHFHILIINMLKLLASKSDSEVADKADPAVSRLTFYLCSLIHLLQIAHGSVVNLLRVNRVTADDVIYDYDARLEIIIHRPKFPLRVVVDNA